MSVILTERIFSQQGYNFLNLRDHFRLTKRTLDGGVVGSDQFLISRASVAQGKIHLHRWHNFQEIRSRTLRPASLDLKFALGRGSKIYLSWKNEAGTQEGVRIENEHSVFWRADQEGNWFEEIPFKVEFEKYYENIFRLLSAIIQHESLPDNESDITFLFNKNSLELQQHGKKISTFVLSSSVVEWGLQGMGEAVVVDEIQENGKVFDFEPPGNWSLIIVLSLFCLFPLIKKISLFPIYVCFVAVMSFWLLDRFHFTHFQLDTISFGTRKLLLTKVEKFRMDVVDAVLGRDSVKIISSEYPGNLFYSGPIFCDESGCGSKDPGEDAGSHPRLMFVGTSQTVGAGAEKMNDAFFAIVHKRLKKVFPGLQTLNISVPGAVPPWMHMVFQKNYFYWKPDFIVVNLGYNGDQNTYEKSIGRILNSASGKKVFLIDEAFEGNRKRADFLRNINRKLSGDKTISSIALNEFMRGLTAKNKEIYWWDVVHFNNRGHKATGDFLADEIIRSSGKAGYTGARPSEE